MTSNTNKKPILIIVMGTSGSGKSTLGTKLAESLKIPFVDGDDLHPQSNIEKMSNGIPLTDEDRLPWLLSIRQKAKMICESGKNENSKDQPNPQQESIRQLAERYETTTQGTNNSNQDDEILNEVEKVRKTLNDQEKQKQVSSDSVNSQNKQHSACVIACSALKQSYRELLRKGLSQNGTDPDPPVDSHLHPDSLDVYHVYLKVSPEELLKRMHERKGHFMKEDMLKSQLATLEDPKGEPKTIILQNAPVERLVEEAKNYFEPIL